jgi:pyruvate dehydrogenase E1 component alpha subunit
MEYTPISAVTAVKNPAADRAAAYGLEPVLVNGNDPDIMYDVACRCLARARAGGGPSLIEALTYRHGGHSRVDTGDDRPRQEAAAWLARDPVPMYRRRLIETGIEDPVLKVIEDETLQALDEATRIARDSPPAPPEIADTNLWADGGVAWRN